MKMNLYSEMLKKGFTLDRPFDIVSLVKPI